MEHLMRMTVCGQSARAKSNMFRFFAAIAVLGALGTAPVAAQGNLPPGTLPPGESRFSSSEIVNTGHRFFGTVSRGLAEIVEKAADPTTASASATPMRVSVRRLGTSPPSTSDPCPRVSARGSRP